MLDPHRLKDSLLEVQKLLDKRGYKLDSFEFQSLEDSRKKIQVETEQLQAKRNIISKEIGVAKKQAGDVKKLMEDVAELGVALKKNENELSIIQKNLHNLISDIPNIPHSSVPDGIAETDNLEIRNWGDTRNFDFKPKDHVEIGESSGLLDFDAAAKITGSRFVVMKGDLATLHRALIQFMMDIHTNEHGYTEVNVPYIVNAQSAFGTGQLPKFESDLFRIKKHNTESNNPIIESVESSSYPEGDDYLYLIPTAEVPVTNIVRGAIIPGEQLPLKYVCHSPCFRSEAGSYGKDTRGMIRHHQFEKVELVHASCRF